jgi:hypothetical protein
VLEFAEGTALAGAEVRVSLDMSVEDFYALRAAVRERTDEGEMELYRRFGDEYLLGWNLEAKGKPVSATGAGMLQIPVRRAGEIFGAWMSALVQPSPNSNAASANGAQSEAGSAQMEAA